MKLTWQLRRPGHIGQQPSRWTEIAEGVLCVDANLNCMTLRVQIWTVQGWCLNSQMGQLHGSTCMLKLPLAQPECVGGCLPVGISTVMTSTRSSHLAFLTAS